MGGSGTLADEIMSTGQKTRQSLTKMTQNLQEIYIHMSRDLGKMEGQLCQFSLLSTWT